jgi:DNA-binding IclR family transcriptional regulator
VTDIDQLSREIEKARRRGYGVCDREASPVLYAVAAPVVNHEGESVAAINVSLTASGLEDEAAAEVTRGVVERGRRISRAYGYEGPYPWPDAEAASVF